MFVVVGVLTFGCGDSGGGGDDGGTDAADGGTGMDAADGGTDASEDGATRACEPGAKRCDDVVPETCAADGSGWETGVACDFVCTAGVCTGECTPGANRCADLVPETCDATGIWIAGTACDFVCTDGVCSGECVPGGVRCTGTQPELCSAIGVFEASGAACDFVCTEGACEGACVPGTKRCGAGGTVELCDETGTYQLDETCGQACDAGACVCAPDYEGDGYDCEPRDFCALPLGGCGPNATCTQVNTTPACVCNTGYEGQGLACSALPTAPSITQGFDDVSMIGAAGWVIQNSSAPVGSTSFRQGTPMSAGGAFDAHEGAPGSYIQADYNNTGNTGTISTWLVSPELDFGDAASFEFYTRKVSTDAYADRLEVRVCSTLPCAAPGQDSVAGYETVLTSINPDLVLGVYPTAWTRVVVTNTNGIPRHGRGRIAFRYYVTGSGLSGANGDRIGLDAVQYSVGAAGQFVSGNVSFVGDAVDITLSLNRQVSLPIAASGAFTFPRTLSPDTPYVITVQGAPAGTTCQVANGTGTMGSAAVTDVVVTCTTE